MHSLWSLPRDAGHLTAATHCIRSHYSVRREATERSQGLINSGDYDASYFGPVSEDEAEEPMPPDPRTLDAGPGQGESTSVGVVMRPAPAVTQEPVCVTHPALGGGGTAAERPLLTTDQWKEAMAGA